MQLLSKNKKLNLTFLVLFSLILLFLSMSLVTSNEDSNQKKNKEDIKNYGICVSNATQQKYSCQKARNINLSECMKNVYNTSFENKTFKKEAFKLCREENKRNSEICMDNFKKAKEECLVLNSEICMDNFKKAKEECLVLKCYNNQADKNYLIKKPSECKKISCEEGYKFFKDECGCGCILQKPKKNETKNETDDKNKTKIPLEFSCKEQLSKIKEELKLIKQCQSDSDCSLGDLNVPCSINICVSSFNKNSDLINLNLLTNEYNQKRCDKICPTYSCLNPEILNAVCENHECKIEQKKEDKKNYCSMESKQSDICLMNYKPVCGWFYLNTKCLKSPCAQEFSNSCFACKNSNVEHWTEGKCPSKVPLPFQ